MSTTTHQSNLDKEESRQDVESAPTQRPKMTPYGHGFWDKEIAPLRKIYLKGMIMTSVLVILLIWGIVSIYWGSLWRQNENSHKITAWVINRDSGAVGSNLTEAFLQSSTGAPGTLNWKSISPSEYSTVESIEHAIATAEKAWIAVEVEQDLTSRLQTARDNADASWNPTNAIKLYYSEARYQTAIDGVVLGATRGLLGEVLPRINSALAAQYLSSISNVATLNALTASPQLIASPVSYSSLNLRPYDQTVATASTFVGLIYLMILAFNITMAGGGLRPVIAPKLKLRSYILMRLLVPITLYFFISFCEHSKKMKRHSLKVFGLPFFSPFCSLVFILLNAPFRVHFGKMFGTWGAGFMTCWTAGFLGMIVLGLATEAFLTLVTVRFIGFALVFFIIINVSTALIPFELQDSFFQYGYAMPFYNIRAILIAVIFNTGSRGTLAWHFGILLAWVVVLIGTLPIWTWMERRREQKAAASNDQVAEKH